MFNEINYNGSESRNLAKLDAVFPVEEILPEQVVSEIKRFKRGEIDNLIIHGLPTPEQIPQTPAQIRDVYEDVFPAYVLRSIGNFLGRVSIKGIENTVRFRTGDLGLVNEETWHGHYQYQYTAFYCLRGDPAAETYFFSANTFIKNAPDHLRELFLTPFVYFPDRPAFSLITSNTYGHSLSHNIYDRSDFERYVKDLDLPDVVKSLEKINGRIHDQDFQKAVTYLTNTLKNPDLYVSYRPGDVALYDERSTLRFSPSYIPTTAQGEDRWLLALTVET
jgi:hypothetical protein